MSKDDENGGLLSKVVKFVRNPVTNWSDLDRPEADRDSLQSKQELKELIERKKRNDFVRKREFEMLRKLRRREIAATQGPAARPSFFQSSMPSRPDERAQTLKKIDEIEAQMSMQWWKTKHRDTQTNSSLFPSDGPTLPPSELPSGLSSSPTPPSAMPATAPPRSQLTPAAVPPGPARPPVIQVPASPAAARRPAAPAPSPAPPPPLRSPVAAASPPFAAPPAPVTRAPAPPPPARGVPPALHDLPVLDEVASTGFSLSRAAAIEVEEFAHDPELEEAAIRFANGDDAGAEGSLLEVLGPKGGRAGHEETWLALFDLYRAAGWQDRFDVAAMDFVGRFQRSAPQWYSMPELVTRLADLPVANRSTQAHWVCPALLNAKSLQTLAESVGRQPAPWRLDWSRLNAIAPESLTPLRRLVDAWAGQAVEIQFIGCDRLEQCLATQTPMSDKSVPADWWHLRLSVLRLLGRVDDFELVALNFCVTYEVSPPSWEAPRARCRATTAEGVPASPPTLLGGLDGAEVVNSDFRPTALDVPVSPVGQVELSGSLTGDITAVIERLEAGFRSADVLRVACARLVRVDFVAAGDLLNWAAAHHARGRQIQFIEVQRLVAHFFNVIGISEHAAIVIRKD